MADFTVVVTGAAIVDWNDPAGAAPSRLNPHPGHPHKRWLATVGQPVTWKALVDGALGPADAALGGRLFSYWAVEAPLMPFSGFGAVLGFSSIVYVTPNASGHYVIGVRRPDGGIEHVHFDAG